MTDILFEFRKLILQESKTGFAISVAKTYFDMFVLKIII